MLIYFFCKIDSTWSAPQIVSKTRICQYHHCVFCVVIYTSQNTCCHPRDVYENTVLMSPTKCASIVGLDQSQGSPWKEETIDVLDVKQW